MQRGHWTYIGQIDCFGIEPEQRDAMFARAAQRIHEAGGELQLSPAENLYFTDRYNLHCDLPNCSETFLVFLAEMVSQLSSGHQPMCIQGYDRMRLQREDILINKGKARLRPYEWKAQELQDLHLPEGN